MTYKQIAAEFLYGCFRAGLCVELLICKLFHDLFGWIAERFESLCVEGMRQMAQLREDSSLRRRILRPPVVWPRRMVEP